MVIGRLEEETASSREECERAAEARVRRIREKYEAELREVERSERQTLEKFNTMKVSSTCSYLCVHTMYTYYVHGWSYYVHVHVHVCSCTCACACSLLYIQCIQHITSLVICQT